MYYIAEIIKSLGIWIFCILWMSVSPICLVYRKLTTGKWLQSGGNWSSLGGMLELLFAPFVLVAWIIAAIVIYIYWH